MLRAYREASRRSYAENADILEGWVWHAYLDRRTCGFCWSQHGSIHKPKDIMATHPNCRCALMPRTVGWEALLGKKRAAGIPDTRPTIEKGEGLFERLSDEKKRGILGPAKFAAYQDGRLKLSDVAGFKRDPKWGPVGYERPLKDILGEKEAATYLDSVRRATAQTAAQTRAMSEAKKLLPPNERHDITKVRLKSRPAERNTVVEPWVDVKGDVADIKAGKAVRKGNTYTVNGRTYGWEPNGRLYPIDGDGFHQLDRGAYKALRVYNTFGDTNEAMRILDLEGIRTEQRAQALKAWRAGRGTH